MMMSSRTYDACAPRSRVPCMCVYIMCAPLQTKPRNREELLREEPPPYVYTLVRCVHGFMLCVRGIRGLDCGGRMRGSSSTTVFGHNGQREMKEPHNRAQHGQQIISDAVIVRFASRYTLVQSHTRTPKHTHTMLIFLSPRVCACLTHAKLVS